MTSGISTAPRSAAATELLSPDLVCAPGGALHSARTSEDAATSASCSSHNLEEPFSTCATSCCNPSPRPNINDSDDLPQNDQSARQVWSVPAVPNMVKSWFNWGRRGKKELGIVRGVVPPTGPVKGAPAGSGTRPR